MPCLSASMPCMPPANQKTNATRFGIKSCWPVKHSRPNAKGATDEPEGVGSVLTRQGLGNSAQGEPSPSQIKTA